MKQELQSYPSQYTLVINVSGGKDSTYMLGQLCEQFPQVKKIAVMADTGFEHKDATAWARQLCNRFGVEFHVVKNPNKTYLEMVERRGKFPSPQYRQCTSDLKRGPIETWIRQAVKSGLISTPVIINCTGIRAQESPARAKQKPLKRNANLSKAGRNVMNWMPIFDASLAEVLNWHEITQTPLHPVYVYAGGYLKRFSCRVCIFATDADIHAIHQNDREAFDLISNLEQRIGFTMRPAQSLIQIVTASLNSAAQYGSEEQRPCA